MTENSADPFAENRTLREQVVQLRAAVEEYDEQQKATAEILRIISSNPTDVQPVFDAILEKAIRLCDAHLGHLGLCDGEKYQYVALRGANVEFAKFASERGPFRPSPGGVVERMIAERQPMQFPDYKESPAYRDRVPGIVAVVGIAGARTFLSVPMLKEGRVVGGIGIYRPEVRPFTQKQIDLVSTFANQAVIAIENVRLFTETKEALERQTATSDILASISGSVTDTTPVFDTIAENMRRLLNSSYAAVSLVRDDRLEFAAAAGDGQYLEKVRAAYPWLLDGEDGALASRAVRNGQVVHVCPIQDAPDAPQKVKQLAAAAGYQSILMVPLLRAGVAIGLIVTARRDAIAFDDRQIALIRAFADQAVIAIENVRLFKELQARNAEVTEALEQQTATAEILRVISSSPTDTQPVFDAIAESAARLCEASDVLIRRVDGDVLRAAAHLGSVPVVRPTIQISRGSPAGRAVLERRTIHVDDVLESRVREEYPDAGSTLHLLVAPLLREDTAIGVITIRRPDARPFSDKQIKLLETFASQAVIAIENVRLFKELQSRNAELTESLEQQTATSEILRVISSSPTDLQPVMDAVVRSAARLCGASEAQILRPDGDVLRLVAEVGSSAMPPARPISRGYAAGRAFVEGRTLHIPDMLELTSDYRETSSPAFGTRTLLATPLMREGVAIGVIRISRREVLPFAEQQIALLKTFADQAVIAIENVRLFKELQARNAEITESLEQQTATAEILKVISGSPTDTQPVFDAIARSGVHLFQGMSVGLRLLKGDRLERAAFAVGRGSEVIDDSMNLPLPLDDRGFSGRAVLRRQVVHAADVFAEEWPAERTRQLAGRMGWRACAAAPMLRENQALGTIVVIRAQPTPFSEKEIALLRTFADQAVIAIENVRLFNETKEALEQQTVISEILRAISSSPTDVQPVFDAVAESAARLCGAHDVVIRLVEGNVHRAVAHHGPIPAAVPRAITRGTIAGRAILDARTIHVPDVAEAHVRDEFPENLALASGLRTTLAVPLVREGTAIGVIGIRRVEVRPFTEKQIKLLETFAAQAVIAIENVRLFKEIQDKSRQLEVASRHKSEFLASMSHELRTPLNAILGFNEMIIHELYGEVPEGMKVPLEDIQSSGKHLLGLINNVLDLAKIEAGRMELALADYSIMDTAESVRSTLRSLAAEKGLEFVVTVPNDMPLVYGDSGRVLQCLVNLAGNSLKFTKAGKVEISARHHDGLLTCCVSDTGVGIPPDKIGSLFTEFKQTDATIASEYGGTGLGLSITKKFIEMHGGRIWVESEVGQGSRFIFEIPLRAVAQATERAHA